MGSAVGKGKTSTRVVTISNKPRPERRSSASNVVGSREAERASSNSSTSTLDVITILHFNDVYNIEERKKEPVGGAPRFKTKVDSLKELDPLILFSGDALNPSNISIVTQGKHMIPVLNSIGIQAAVYGNHEFDFGLDHLAEVTQQMNFPWLMSNIVDRNTGKLLADGLEKLVLHWKGKKIGLIGLVEWEWIVTLATIEPEDIEYTDYVQTAKRLIPELQEEGCDLIIALTHMRMPNDTRLAEEVPELHLILGGHDHDYDKKKVNGVTVLKSGSDFRQFSQITVTFDSSDSNMSRPTFDIIEHTIKSDIPPDTQVQAIVDQHLEKLEAGMQEEIGVIDCDLDGRFSAIRTQETNLGNLITDIMKKATRADIALLNSGTMRSDSVHEAGVFRMKDLLSILPMVDPLAVLEITGEQLIEALENGTSQYPKHEGRFPQVSGLSFTFDPSKQIGHKVIVSSVQVDGKPLQMNQKYKLCTKVYIAAGKDGYDVFKRCKVLVSQEEGPILGAIVRNHFTLCTKLQCRSNNDVDGFTRSTIRLLESDGGKIQPQVEGRINIVFEPTF